VVNAEFTHAGFTTTTISCVSALIGFKHTLLACPMNNAERIIQYLSDNTTGACDDCLSVQLKIKPRQQVNRICRKLQREGKITRGKERCPGRDGLKIVNKLVIKY